MNNLELYNLKKNINKVISKLNKKYGDMEYYLDGIFDYIDNTLTYQENTGALLQEIADRGFDPFFKLEKLEQKQNKELRIVEDNLLLFKNQLFAVRGKISKLISLNNYYEKGYRTLLRLKDSLEVISNPKERLRLSKTDLFSYFQANQKRWKPFKTEFGNLKPEEKEVRELPPLSQF